MRGRVYRSILLMGLIMVLATRLARAQWTARDDYMHDCAQCHSADGKGVQAEKRAVPGYVSIDLTQVSKRNAGEFPRQKIYDMIDGRNRIRAHFQGDMPRWGARYRVDANNNPVDEQQVHKRISALVDYIESLQQK